MMIMLLNGSMLVSRPQDSIQLVGRMYSTSDKTTPYRELRGCTSSTHGTRDYCASGLPGSSLDFVHLIDKKHSEV